MKQSAVEWYGVKIGILLSKFLNNEISKGELHFGRFELEEQAKEMEKQQIIDSISNANKSNNRNVSLNPEQYYNETFENK
jgi:hypothetical protein